MDSIIKHTLMPLMISILVISALRVGYLVGYSEGWDLGRTVGKIDAQGLDIKHNGVKE